MSETIFFHGPCSESDRNGIVALESLAWGPVEPGSNEYFEWQYLKNPTGLVFISCAQEPEGMVVAHNALIPVPVLLRGRKITVGFSVNAVTHPDYRRRGLSVKTAQCLLEQASKAGIDCIISMPNEMSHELYRSKLNFTRLGVPWLLVRWIDPGVFLAQHNLSKTGKTVSAVIRFASNVIAKHPKKPVTVRRLTDLKGLAIEKLWEQTEFIAATDTEWLKWRYLDHPTRHYEFALVGEPEEPQALAVYQILELYKKALLMEFFAIPEVTVETIQGLMGYVTESCRKAGCSALWSLSTPRSRKAHMLRKSGFWLVPGNLSEKSVLMLKKNEAISGNIRLADMDISFGGLINYE
ncbi:MAG: GNAT family N-acetyltransferase [Deltaproteobacteria bacterium]